MTESLLSTREHWAEPPTSGLRAVVSQVPPIQSVEAAIDDLSEACRTGDLPRLLQAVAILVPEYEPSAALTQPHEALA